MLVIILSILTSLISGYFLLLTLANVFFLRRNSLPASVQTGPKVSVMVPARNEAANIRACLDSLLRQTYTNYEVIVLDDNSTDETWQILQEYQAIYPDKCRIYQGKPLPSDWYGKPYALQQLSEYATGDMYLFTDADTVHEPGSVSFAVTNMIEHKASYLSGYPRQIVKSLGEKITVPSMYIMTSMVLPLFLIPRTKRPAHSFSIGQYVVYRAEVFKQIDGYASIRKQVTDDIFMVRNLKRLGLKTIFLDAQDYVSCRMYQSYREGFVGISRSVFPSLEYNSWQYVGMTFFLFFVVLLPIIVFLQQLLSSGMHLFFAMTPVVLFLLFWIIKMHNRRITSAAFLYPILFVSLIGMGFLSYLKIGLGKGIVWKGRLVK